MGAVQDFDDDDERDVLDLPEEDEEDEEDEYVNGGEEEEDEDKRPRESGSYSCEVYRQYGKTYCYETLGI